MPAVHHYARTTSLGEKHSNWRGGYRVAAFVAGGLLPAKLAGTTTNLRIHVVDWCAPPPIFAPFSVPS